MLAEWGEGGGGVGAVHRLPDVGRPPRPRLSTGLPGLSAGCRPEKAAVTWEQELDAEEVTCCEGAGALSDWRYGVRRSRRVTE